MNRPAAALVPALVLVLVLALASCARTKSEPAPAPSVSSSTSPASASPAPEGGSARIKLCSDGLHRPGDHWKEACNPCRCAANGEITCTRFPCPPVGDAGPQPREAGAAAEGGASAP